MNEERLYYLLKKYRNQTYTAKEQTELNAWYDSLEHRQDDFERWVEELGNEEALANQLYLRFEESIRKRRSTRIRTYALIGTAASILLFTLVHFLIKQPGISSQKKEVVGPLHDNNTNRNKAILTLADGSTFMLEDEVTGKIASQSGVNIIKSKSGELLYDFSSQTFDNETSVYNSIQTPKGGQYTVILPDGSKVWLNSDSKISFPVPYRGKDREVILSGEAYFEIRQLAKTPFKVVSDNQEIHVLGTHFNVQAYVDEATARTTLLEGSVSVKNTKTGQHCLLKPGQQADLQSTNETIKIQKANVEEAVSWKNGYFLFDNQPIEQIMKTISRWYDVQVIFEGVNKEEAFGGTFSRSSDLQDILTALAGLGNIQFTTENKIIIVKAKYKENHD